MTPVALAARGLPTLGLQARAVVSVLPLPLEAYGAGGGLENEGRGGDLRPPSFQFPYPGFPEN